MLLLTATIVLGACGDDPSIAASTQPSVSSTDGSASGPDESLGNLLEALAAEDYAATTPYVDETQLALFASIESGDPATLLSMAESGVPDEVRDNFWSSFVEAIPGLAGAEPDGIVLDEPELSTVGSVEFAVVDVEFVDSDSSGSWVLRKTESGEWVVDVIGTFGSAFVSPLSGWLAAMDPGRRAEVADAVAGHDASWDQLIVIQGNDDVGDIVRGAVQELRRLIPSG